MQVALEIAQRSARRQEVIFSFGRFRLIPRRQLLLLDGRPVRLGGRAFELLQLLVARCGELVSKDELMAAAWPDIFVHDSNLKVNMSGLRRSLGDTQIEPVYIATVARRGYKFIADVQTSVAEVEDDPALAEPVSLSGPPLLRGIVGREADMADIADLLVQKRHVTLTGAGGVGKTTLAVAAARAFASRCRDGICFVDLATISDPTLFGAALVTALGIRGNPDNSLGAVLDYLRPRQKLIILDNCEHVLPAATIFAGRLLADADASLSKLLATSREPLGTATEHVVRLRSLSSPRSGEALTADQALSFPAIQLFVRCATEWSDYHFEEADCEAIASICHSLDGLPLAIELAAAQIGTFSPRELVAMLDQDLGFRAPSSEGAPPRHETLMATIDWSFKLLSQKEAMLFGLLSVFSAAFEAEDAVFVAEAAGLTPVDVVTGLGSLVAKSLVSAQAKGASLRYRLLDSTRRYAAERRQTDPAVAQALRYHAQRVLTLFSRSEEEWNWREPADWTQRYLGRIADLRTALSWAFGEEGDSDLGIKLTVAAITLWSETSILSEAQARLETALALAKTIECDDLSKAKLACALGWSLFYARKMSNENEVAWLDAISFARRAKDIEYQQRALVGFAFYLLQIGCVPRAIAHLEESAGLAERDRDSTATSEGDRALAWARAHAGELAESRRVLDRLAAMYSLADGRSRKDANEVYRFTTVRFNLPFVAWMQGDVDYAARLARDAVEAADRSGHWVSQSNALGLAALPVSLETGNLEALESYTGRLRRNLERERISRWIPVERYFSACLRDLRGDPKAVDDIRAAIDELIECRFLMRIGSYLSVLARALLSQGRIEEARETIAQALDCEQRQGERWCRPELQRVDASVLFRAGEPVRAEKRLQEALVEARAIGAKTFELRCATDLAAHWIATGRRPKAARLLAPIYQKFTEGFETRDLVAATQMLHRARTNNSGRN